MAQVAVFLDGAYLRELSRKEFRGVAVDYGQLAGRIRDRIAGDTVEPLDILRTYYYDCPPFQSEPPTDEESRRYANYRRFTRALSYLPRFEVRLGRLQLQGRRTDDSPIFRQKQVDLLLGLDPPCSAARTRSRMSRWWPATATSCRRCGPRSRKASRSGSSTARARA